MQFFKFDFLVWLDCAGQGDLYGHARRASSRCSTRCRPTHPHVVFQIDETNDYRLFPFESVSRGPTWFQNGAPDPDRLLHNLWTLSPYVPAFALGQKALAGEPWKRWPIDTVMATALLSEIMFVSDLRSMPADVMDAARPWVDFAKAHRAALDGVVFPLLADPLERGWTALQSWDPEAARGVLLAFRQDGAETTRTIALRAVPPGRTLHAARRADGRGRRHRDVRAAARGPSGDDRAAARGAGAAHRACLTARACVASIHSSQRPDAAWRSSWNRYGRRPPNSIWRRRATPPSTEAIRRRGQPSASSISGNGRGASGRSASASSSSRMRSLQRS